MERREQKKLQIICGYLDELLPQFEYSKPQKGLQIVGKFDNVNTPTLIEKCTQSKVEFINMASHNALEFNFDQTSIHDTYNGLRTIAKSI